MRLNRLKVDSSLESSSYHLINRIVGGEWLLRDSEKEILRRQMWATAKYCGLQVLTYALMSNHYHFLVKVPKRWEVSDAELLRLYREFYPRMNQQHKRRLEEVERDMAINGPQAQKWRERQLRQMFDISKFCSLVEQRFTIWYNKSHGRKGTLWMGRFRSILVEDGDALREIALYIDMNACRAGLESDPKDYRFCGYAEAVAGLSRAREGLQEIFQSDWSDCSERYRAYLLEMMKAVVAARAQPGSEQVTFNSNAGHLNTRASMHCRIRYFVDGLVLGSAAYVREKAALLPGERKRPARSLRDLGLLDGLHVVGRLLRFNSHLACESA